MSSADVRTRLSLKPRLLNLGLSVLDQNTNTRSSCGLSLYYWNFFKNVSDPHQFLSTVQNDQTGSDNSPITILTPSRQTLTEQRRAQDHHTVVSHPRFWIVRWSWQRRPRSEWENTPHLTHSCLHHLDHTQPSNCMSIIFLHVTDDNEKQMTMCAKKQMTTCAITLTTAATLTVA